MHHPSNLGALHPVNLLKTVLTVQVQTYVNIGCVTTVYGASHVDNKLQLNN